jgi:hypothetical protein
MGGNNMAWFEYFTVAVSSRDMNGITAKLNKYGKEGWELTSSIAQPRLGNSQYNLFGVSLKNILIFKRRRKVNGEEVTE